MVYLRANYLDGPRYCVRSGNYLYVPASNDGYINVFDVSNPSNLSRVGGVYDYDHLGTVYVVVIQGSLLYSVSNDEITVWDISTPTSPTYVDTCNTSAQGRDIKVIGNYAYTVWSDDDSFRIFDISNTPPDPPTQIAIRSGASYWLLYPFGIDVVGNYAYIAARDGNALTIFDISTPSNPTWVGKISGMGSPNYLYHPMRIVVLDNYAYITANLDDSLTIIDISTPSSPTFAGNIMGSGSPNYLHRPDGLDVLGKYAYVAAGGDDSLTIIDISTPSNPTFVANIAGGGPPYYLDQTVGVLVEEVYE